MTRNHMHEEAQESKSFPEGHKEDPNEQERTHSIPELTVQYLQATRGTLSASVVREPDQPLIVPSRGQRVLHLSKGNDMTPKLQFSPGFLLRCHSPWGSVDIPHPEKASGTFFV